MSAGINYASRMTSIIDLQICKAHDEAVIPDVKCDSQSGLLYNVASLLDVSSAELHDVCQIALCLWVDGSN